MLHHVTASILERPATFDRVDLVKEAVGEPVLPGDDCFWILGDVLVFAVDTIPATIPKGFTTDGASVPGWGTRCTGWRPWDPPQRWAGIVHDWLYCDPQAKRRIADRIFREILRSEGASLFERWVMWSAVRVGGWKAFGEDQERGPRIYV